MHGLMMDYQLTIPALLRRAERVFPHKAIVSRRPDKRVERTTIGDVSRRARRLASALKTLGVQPGDRVATLSWNHAEHLEAYFGVPSAGAVIHTLNLRLHPDELAYIVNHAKDRVLLVDHVLLPLFEKFRARTAIDHVVVIGGPAPAGMLEYEALLADADEAFDPGDLDERSAAAMCYTTGTTGAPKGVLYSHRALVLHSLAGALRDNLGIGECDIVLPVVPMFHANAWGLPYMAAVVGASMVFPGPHLDPVSLLDLLQSERVTITAGVPTIWMGLLQVLDKQPGAYDLSRLQVLIVGGSAVPPAMMRAFHERHGLRILHAWGMTEMAPLGTVSATPSELQGACYDDRLAIACKQGRPAPFVEIRARGDEGFVPWDGQAMGELEVRGPWVASAYFDNDSARAAFTDDGWFRTGDIVTIDQRAYIQIQDRSKDLIKSGGEWISSVALENALMGHPGVAEAAVIPIPHPKWDERPLAVVVRKEGATVGEQELIDFLKPQFAKICLPDGVAFVAEIPRTSAGKFKKSALREQFKNFSWP